MQARAMYACPLIAERSLACAKDLSPYSHCQWNCQKFLVYPIANLDIKFDLNDGRIRKSD